MKNTFPQKKSKTEPHFDQDNAPPCDASGRDYLNAISAVPVNKFSPNFNEIRADSPGTRIFLPEALDFLLKIVLLQHHSHASPHALVADSTRPAGARESPAAGHR
jgi:hypothetical protein